MNKGFLYLVAKLLVLAALVGLLISLKVSIWLVLLSLLFLFASLVLLVALSYAPRRRK